MRQEVSDRVRWTTADIDLLPENEGTRYEIVDGELFMTRAPHWRHQETCLNIGMELKNWSRASGLGEASINPGVQNERRDKIAKLKLYASRGVQEYWITDWRLQQVEVYRRENATLKLMATLLSNDELISPLLPGFTCPVARFFG